MILFDCGIHCLPSPMFLNLKYQETGTMSNLSQWFVKAPIAGPHLFLSHILSKSTLRGINTAGIVLSSLNFPYLTPVSAPERVWLSAKGDFKRPHPTLLQDHMLIFQLQFHLIVQLQFLSFIWYFSFRFSVSLEISTSVSFLAIHHFRSPHWVPLAATRAAGRDLKW